MHEWVGLYDVNLQHRVHVRAAAITAFFKAGETVTVVLSSTRFYVRETEDEICRLLGIRAIDHEAPRR